MKKLSGLVLFLVACGGAPSALTLCNESCDKQASCNSATEEEKSTCLNTCKTDNGVVEDEVQMVKDNCKNPDTVLNKAQDCVQKYCEQSDVDNCVDTAIGDCDAKNS
jgi:hypothetical protein